MEGYKENFIRFILDEGALEIGEKTLKSGRVSPYFFNAGQFDDGRAMSRVGSYFGEALNADLGPDGYDVLFGPAMKGVPLALATTMALHRDHNVNKGWCANRQVAKTHGEGTKKDFQRNWLVGSGLKDGNRVVMIDDVITTGETKYDALQMLWTAADVEVVGLYVMLDRCEVGDDGRSAAQTFSERTDIDVGNIIDVGDLCQSRIVDETARSEIRRYLSKYGTSDVKRRVA